MAAAVEEYTNQYIRWFTELSIADVPSVGGKNAGLGELTKALKELDIRVPEGFATTAEAYRFFLESNDLVKPIRERLDALKSGAITLQQAGTAIRRLLLAATIPQPLADEVCRAYRSLSARYNASEVDVAVRSSATAEDLPTASFAGQQDSYLNVVGPQAILQHISKCWASLFTDRAAIYRLQNGFDHRKVRLAVVVQKMVFPQAAGILFTADPVTGNRRVVSVDAGPGLGDALVSGLVNADVYKIRDGQVVDRKVRMAAPVLADEELVRLERLARSIEAHFGRPQDIEWCLAGGVFSFVQSRPITTLYPIPFAPDVANHVYVSVGHQQMMTDAMRPLGISFWNLTAFRPMSVAGGRLFVDVTRELTIPAKRGVLLGVLGKNDPLIRDALTTIVERGDFVAPEPDDAAGGKPGPSPFQTLQDYDVSVVDELVARSAAATEDVWREIGSKSGLALIDFILHDVQQLKKIVGDPRGFGVIMTGMNAAAWINDKMQEWLGEKNAADTIALSVPNNVTSEMGLALLDVADVIRPFPEVVSYLERVGNDLAGWDGLAGLDGLAGGRESRDAIQAFLDKYGMRCAGEIDITRTRWSEQPAILIPLILGNVRNFESGAGKRKFEQGLCEAADMERKLFARLRQLPDGEVKSAETKRMIGLVRNLSGYREYPKYAIVSRYFIYKQALLSEARRLVGAGVLHSIDDIYYLSFDELGEVMRTGKLDRSLLETRREEYRLFERLSPPRVITSDGEIITGAYKRQGLPAGAIPGLAVSSGVIEGRARVILKMEDAVLEEGDILVTRFTDPSWTPLFVSIKGLVTEVGGLMTHGAVIAREYGLPAVVGVEGATQLIKDGEMIRVNGTVGYVEVLTYFSLWPASQWS